MVTHGQGRTSIARGASVGGDFSKETHIHMEQNILETIERCTKVQSRTTNGFQYSVRANGLSGNWGSKTSYSVLVDRRALGIDRGMGLRPQTRL